MNQKPVTTHRVRPNVTEVLFEFLTIDDQVTIARNGDTENAWLGSTTGGQNNSQYSLLNSPESALSGRDTFEVTATNTTFIGTLKGNLRVKYDDGTEDLVTEWDISARGLRNSETSEDFYSGIVTLIYEEQTPEPKQLEHVVFEFTQIDDYVEIFVNGSSEPVHRHRILRGGQDAFEVPLDYSVENRIVVKAFNTAGLAALHGSVKYRYSDGTETEDFKWEIDNTHHVPRYPLPFLHAEFTIPPIHRA